MFFASKQGRPVNHEGHRKKQKPPMGLSLCGDKLVF